MKHVIVTGASGFIGRALVKRLISEQYSVCAVVRRYDRISDLCCPNLSIVEEELDNYAHLAEKLVPNQYDTFFHLAWDGIFGDPSKDYRRQLNNAAAAADALMAAVKLNCRQFILAGTCAELEALELIKPDCQHMRTGCIYGTAKAAAEMICKVLARENKIDFNAAILASTYGEGDRSDTIQTVLIRALLEGRSPKLLQGEILYDWLYVDDAVSALLAISQHGKPNRSYYVGHDELHTFKELVTKTRDIIAPSVRLRFGEYPEGVRIDYSKVDLTALYRDTGFKCQADLCSSIKKTADWLKSTS